MNHALVLVILMRAGGYDPVDSMQGLDIGSHQGSNYGPMPDLGTSDLHFDGLDNNPMGAPAPQPPHGAGPQHPDNQMAAWFDTDL